MPSASTRVITFCYRTSVYSDVKAARICALRRCSNVQNETERILSSKRERKRCVRAIIEMENYLESMKSKESYETKKKRKKNHKKKRKELSTEQYIYILYSGRVYAKSGSTRFAIVLLSPDSARVAHAARKMTAIEFQIWTHDRTTFPRSFDLVFKTASAFLNLERHTP